MEMTVLEPLQCPSCSTRFGLSASRVRPGIRRARCFRCETLFGIEAEVARLLATVAEPVEPLVALEPEVESPEPLVVPALDESGPDDFSLTLGDLEGTEAEILDKTLTDIPLPLAPQPATEILEAPDLPDPSDSPYAAAGNNYASARDAIAKLMGDAPSIPTPPRSLASRNTMDVEATLNALETTLGGTPIHDLQGPPAAPPRAMDTGSTVKLSSHEIRAAMAAAAPTPAPFPPRLEPIPRPEALAVPSLDPNATHDSNLLKVQLEQETCNNVTLEQMTSWIDQGKVHEYHMVARQFSDNWIEASKVPALRPVFERRRRQIPGPVDLPNPPAEIVAPKKGLFGGLFHRN